MPGRRPWDQDGALPAARAALLEARGIVVLTGAGVSAESGVPTFREPGSGLWARYRPEELATPQAFARDSRLVWEWYDMRRQAVRACAPNPAHRALARLLLEREDVTLVTQNVDGLHQRALEDEADERAETNPKDARTRVLPLHGTLFRVKCSGCGRARDHAEPVDTTSLATLPRCSVCDDLERPDVVWFGEPLPAVTLERAFRAAGVAEICLVVGTSGQVHPAASVATVTLESGGRLIEVNPHPSALSPRAAWRLRGPAGEVLPRLIR